MDIHIENLVSALKSLPLDEIPINDFDQWVTIDNNSVSLVGNTNDNFLSLPTVVPPSFTENNDISILNILKDNDDNNITLYSFSSAAVLAITSINKWMTIYNTLPNDNNNSSSSSSLMTTSSTTVLTVNNLNQQLARANIWEAINSITPKCCKALAMYLNRAMVLFLSTTPTNKLVSSQGTVEALVAVELYWKFITIPGSQAYGIFDANIIHRTMTTLRRYFELATVSTKNDNINENISVPTIHQSTKRSRTVAMPPTPEGVRRNPRRQTATNVDMNDDNDEDENDHTLAVQEEEENRPIATTRGRRNGKNGNKKTNTSVGANTVVFTSEDIYMLNRILGSLNEFLSTFSLRVHQEFILVIIDALAYMIMFPVHLMPNNYSSIYDDNIDGSKTNVYDNLLISLASCFLAILQTKHASPLDTARALLKKLKPFMLYGHSGTALIPSMNTNNNSTIDNSDNLMNMMVMDNNDTMNDPFNVHLGTDTDNTVDLGHPVCPPDARTVRGRTLYLTRVIISDQLSGKVNVVGALSTKDNISLDSIQPIPNSVLVRLPAVTALLQHLTTSATIAKSDVRAITCDIIAHLRACLPHSLRRAFVRFIIRFGRNSKASYRLLAVEVTGRLLGAGGSTTSNSLQEAFIFGNTNTENGDSSNFNRSNESSDEQSISSPILAIALSELPVPTAADKLLESEGYGDEGYEYADVNHETTTDNLNNNTNNDNGNTKGNDNSDNASIVTGRSSIRRRASILGGEYVHTPYRSDRPSLTTPGSNDNTTTNIGGPQSSHRLSTGGKSRGPGSPFYGNRQRRNSTAPGMTPSSVFETEDDRTVDGCCDPRPTVTMLVDFLYHRSSDRSPAVRAKAIAILATLVDPTLNPHARFISLLLTHIAYTAALIQAVSTSLSPSDVTLVDTTLGNNNALSSALAAVATNNIPNNDIVLPLGISALAANGPSPLVPLFVRRMSDNKPAVRKAAVQAAIALALSGGSDMIIYASSLIPSTLNTEDDYTNDDGVNDTRSVRSTGKMNTLSWSTAQNLHEGVYRTAKMFVNKLTNTVVNNGSSVLGLWALQTISAKATDGSILVRRCAMSGIQSLLMAEPYTPALQQLWLATVLPLVADSENTVVVRAIECVREAIMDGLLVWHTEVLRREKLLGSKTGKNDPSLQEPLPILSWKLLDYTSGNSDLSRCLGIAISIIAKGTGTNTTATDSNKQLALGKLITALQHGASATETKSWDAKEGAMVTTALSADTNIDLGSSNIKTINNDEDDYMLDDESNGSNDGAHVTACTFRRASWLMLELLASYYASSTITGGGIFIKTATTAAGSLASFITVVPFLIRSWGTILRALRARARLLSGMNTTTTTTTIIDNDTTMVSSALSTVGSIEHISNEASRILRILTLLSPVLKKEHAKGLVDSVIGGLRSLQWDPTLISAGVRMIATVSASHSGSDNEMRDVTNNWSNPITSTMEEILREALSQPQTIEIEKINSLLFTVGELAMIGLDADAGQGVSESSIGKSSSSKDTDDYNRRLLTIHISERIITLIQGLLVPLINNVSIPDGVRAHAYLCLGKLCLRDNNLAKRFVAVFARDLSAQLSPPAVRNNILFVLGDMCVRYTAMIDRYFNAMVESLNDPLPLIRKHSLVLLTQLVTSDYLKWRGYLFYRFAAAIADTDDDVRNTAVSVVTGPLISKHRLLLQNHFVDLVFVLTGCSTHPAYAHLLSASGAKDSSANVLPIDNGMEENDDTNSNVALTTSLSSSSTVSATDDQSLKSLIMPDAYRRMAIYHTLLNVMPKDQRFTVHAKLALEVLGGLLEEKLQLTPRDKLMMLMKENHLSSNTSNAFPVHMQAFTPQAASKLNATLNHNETETTNNSTTIWFPLGTTEALVAEVFAILSSPDMRIGHGKNSNENTTANDEDGEMMNEEDTSVVLVQTMAQAENRIMAKLARKQVIENVMPICIGLKQIFTRVRSPLMGSLMGYLLTLFTDYGDDLKEVLSADRQTAAELEFDLRLYSQGQMDAYGQPLVPTTATNSVGTNMNRRGSNGGWIARTPKVSQNNNDSVMDTVSTSTVTKQGLATPGLNKAPRSIPASSVVGATTTIEEKISVTSSSPAITTVSTVSPPTPGAVTASLIMNGTVLRSPSLIMNTPTLTKQAKVRMATSTKNSPLVNDENSENNNNNTLPPPPIITMDLEKNKDTEVWNIPNDNSETTDTVTATVPTKSQGRRRK